VVSDNVSLSPKLNLVSQVLLPLSSWTGVAAIQASTHRIYPPSTVPIGEFLEYWVNLYLRANSPIEWTQRCEALPTPTQ